MIDSHRILLDYYYDLLGWYNKDPRTRTQGKSFQWYPWQMRFLRALYGQESQLVNQASNL